VREREGETERSLTRGSVACFIIGTIAHRIYLFH